MKRLPKLEGLIGHASRNYDQAEACALEYAAAVGNVQAVWRDLGMYPDIIEFRPIVGGNFYPTEAGGEGHVADATRIIQLDPWGRPRQ